MAARKNKSADNIDTQPDTLPVGEPSSELVEAVEWLRSAGIVTGEKPPFAKFFDEVANED